MVGFAQFLPNTFFYVTQVCSIFGLITSRNSRKERRERERERERERDGNIGFKATTLSNSPEFHSACDSAYEESLSLSQHAFAGVHPYQLLSAAAHIHRNLFSFPLIIRWVPSPPSQSQVDSALRVIASRVTAADILGPEEFKEWAIEVFTETVVGNARKAVASRIPAGIAGIGAVTRSGQNLIGAAIGVYAVGVATSVFLSLSD
ncbi:unnamed protein product [Brassica oleracea]